MDWSPLIVIVPLGFAKSVVSNVGVADVLCNRSVLLPMSESFASSFAPERLNTTFVDVPLFVIGSKPV